MGNSYNNLRNAGRLDVLCQDCVQNALDHPFYLIRVRGACLVRVDL